MKNQDDRKVYTVREGDMLTSIALDLLGDASLWNQKLYKEDGSTFKRGNDEIIFPKQKIYYYEENIKSEEESDDDLVVTDMENIFMTSDLKPVTEEQKKIKENWKEEDLEIDFSYKKQQHLFSQNENGIENLKINYMEKLNASYFEPLFNNMQENVPINSMVVSDLDEEKLMPGTRERLHYLLDKIYTLEEGETVLEKRDSIVGSMPYTRDDYIREYNTLMDYVESPVYEIVSKGVIKIENVLNAASQAYGGYTEAVAGYEFAKIGLGLLGTGLVTIVGGTAVTVATGIFIVVGGVAVLGTGVYLMADGASNAFEGTDKFFKEGGADIIPWQDESFNALRDLGYEKLLGEKKGELYYNRAALGAGVICIGKDIYDIRKDIIKGKVIHKRVRKSQTAKAERLGLKTERVWEYRRHRGNKLVLTVKEINPNIAKPMILERTFIELPEFVKTVGGAVNDVKGTKGAFESSNFGVGN